MKSFLFALLVGLSSFAQSFGLSFFGVKPNLAMAAVVAACFFAAGVWEKIFLAVLAAFILKFSEVFEESILFFLIIVVLAAVAAEYLPWRGFFGCIFIAAAGTVVFYLFVSPALIVSVVFLKEFVLNAVAAGLFFALLNRLWQNKIQ